MTLFARTASRRPHRPACPLAGLALAAPLEDADDDGPAGPGWYESSWDLLNGLEVCEAPIPEGAAP